MACLCLLLFSGNKCWIQLQCIRPMPTGCGLCATINVTFIDTFDGLFIMPPCKLEIIILRPFYYFMFIYYHLALPLLHIHHTHSQLYLFMALSVLCLCKLHNHLPHTHSHTQSELSRKRNPCPGVEKMADGKRSCCCQILSATPVVYVSRAIDYFNCI